MTRSSGARRALRLIPLITSVVVACGVVLGAATLADHEPDAPPPLGATLGEGDRRELDAPEVRRGDAPPAPDPAVDLADPEAVARAYLSAAHGARPEDAGRTHRRAAAYAVPGTPPATVGILVLDPPPAGTERLATVDALGLAAADRGDRRRGYAATVTTTVTPGGVPDSTYRYVVLARQDDGRWLVAAESPWTPDLPAGES